ncbi:S26 family signal peptidase [Natrononativus amylolyticus]|uniref:S26 family signal peptidase n=1 Tax=Natrononativus amylolyticus TaxID=2963434 RepID=UPI0020CE1C55|nr:S26 family signal peptidase [Natrononativus amylolyticus]
MSGPGPGDDDERYDRDSEEIDAEDTDAAPAAGSGDALDSTAAASSDHTEDGATREGREGSRSAPPPAASSTDEVTIEDDGVVRWFLKSDDGTVVAVRDVLSSIAVVALIGLILFAVSGIWPPLVAVESGSMEPNMERGDLIFITADDRFVGDDAVDGTGVVTLESGEQNGYDKFGEYGDVIVFAPNGNEFETPIIHRAHFWVEEGDDWVEMANPDYVEATNCDQIQTCPAEHDGFITKGDNNPGYDQDPLSRGAPTDVVQSEWVTGKGMFRIPWLGYVRLTFDELLAGMLIDSPTLPEGTSTGPSSVPVGLVGLASAVAVVGGRRSGHW